MVEQRDPEQAETELRMSKDINAMPEKVRDRFKALKVLHDSCTALDEEEEKAFRAIELKYETMYQAVYKQRAQLISGEGEVTAEMMEQYTFREGKLKDDKFAEVDIDKPCDVKAIQGSAKGVSDFWSRVLESNGNTAKQITDKDRPIIGYCNNIETTLHTEDQGFSLKMHFENNQYFEGNVLSVSFYQKKPNQVEKIEGTEISWKAGCDPTKVKKTKKKKGKKITTTESVESFFDIFASHVAEVNDKPAEEDDDDHDESAEKMDRSLELANQIKDQVVPLALELYLGVVEFDDESDNEDDDDNEDAEFDEDEGPAPKKGGKPLGGKGANKEAPKGKDGKECKQQ